MDDKENTGENSKGEPRCGRGKLASLDRGTERARYYGIHSCVGRRTNFSFANDSTGVLPNQPITCSYSNKLRLLKYLWFRIQCNFVRQFRLYPNEVQMI
jgi:hypothetical protein